MPGTGLVYQTDIQSWLEFLSTIKTLCPLLCPVYRGYEAETRETMAIDLALGGIRLFFILFFALAIYGFGVACGALWGSKRSPKNTSPTPVDREQPYPRWFE